MNKIGLNIGAVKCCENCKYAKQPLFGEDRHFIRCTLRRFNPFKQFICNSYGSKERNNH